MEIKKSLKIAFIEPLNLKDQIIFPYEYNFDNYDVETMLYSNIDKTSFINLLINNKFIDYSNTYEKVKINSDEYEFVAMIDEEFIPNYKTTKNKIRRTFIFGLIKNGEPCSKDETKINPEAIIYPTSSITFIIDNNFNTIDVYRDINIFNKDKVISNSSNDNIFDHLEVINDIVTSYMDIDNYNNNPLTELYVPQIKSDYVEQSLKSFLDKFPNNEIFKIKRKNPINKDEEVQENNIDNTKVMYFIKTTLLDIMKKLNIKNLSFDYISWVPNKRLSKYGRFLKLDIQHKNNITKIFQDLFYTKIVNFILNNYGHFQLSCHIDEIGIIKLDIKSLDNSLNMNNYLSSPYLSGITSPMANINNIKNKIDQLLFEIS